jgi:hypothetical protein
MEMNAINVFRNQIVSGLVLLANALKIISKSLENVNSFLNLLILTDKDQIRQEINVLLGLISKFMNKNVFFALTDV